MSLRPWTPWPADEPPDDFADRMVDRLLQSPPVLPKTIRARRRWVVALACAAVLAGTTAWAMIQYAGPTPPAAPAVSFAPPPPAPEPPAIPAGRGASPEPALTGEQQPAPSASVPAVRSHGSAPPAHSASAPAAPASSSAKRVVVPRCECGPGSVICTCVE